MLCYACGGAEFMDRFEQSSFDDVIPPEDLLWDEVVHLASLWVRSNRVFQGFLFSNWRTLLY